jgi:hypothetical protein
MYMSSTSTYLPTYLPTYLSFYLPVCLSLCLSVCLWLYSPLLDLGLFLSFLILQTVGRSPWTSDHPVARPLPTHRTAKPQNKRTQTSMPWVGFELTIPGFERAKRVHALDRAVTVVGCQPLFFFGGVGLTSPGTAATSGLLYSPRW